MSFVAVGGIWGAHAPKTMNRLRLLGDALTNAELHDEALNVENELRQIRATVRGWEDPDTLESCRRLASVLVALGQHTHAMGVLDPALHAHCRLYGREHHYTLEVVDLLVTSLCELGQHPRVEQLLRVLGLTDDEMLLRAASMQARQVRCRSGRVSVLASCPRFDLWFPAD
jgi:hypothetical protein